MAWIQHAQKITVPANDAADYTLPARHTPLDRLTIWASSGRRSIASLTFQPQVNGKTFGPNTSIVSSAAADVIYASGGSSTENYALPFFKAGLDEFTFGVHITNSDAADATVTIYAVAFEHVP